MKKNIRYITIAAACMAVAAMIIGCNPNVSTAQDTTPPAEVTELTAVAGNGKVSLSWTNPADADLYQVEITASPAAGSLAHPVYLSAEKGKEMSFTAEGLSNGTAYTFTVKTIDKSLNKSAGISTAEAVKPIDTSDKTPPAEVTELKAVAGNGKVSLSWVNPADADLYQVEITASPAAGTLAHPVYLSAEKGKAMSFTAEGLTNGTAYTFTVKTIDKALNKSKDGVSKTVTTNAASSVMSITLEQNPEQTIWTKDSVTITVKSNTSIKEAKWKEGSGHSAKDVLENGTAITGNSFTVTVNGIYSVAVQDNDGRREVETIEIKNIDKIAPQAPMNLTAEYRLGEKKIILKWSDPVDTASGLKELKLSYTVNGAHEKTETIAKGRQTFEIENVEPQSSPVPYAFSLKAVDNAGNEGAAATVSVTPSEQAEITGISLNRTHLDTLMSNRGIEVTITGSNFDKLTNLLVQVTDGSTNQPPITATIDAPNNKATATVQAPKPTSPTDKGTTYTVKAIVNSATPAKVTASFIVSAPAKVSNIALTPDKLKLGSVTKVSVAVTGTNFDIRGATKIKLLDSNGDEVSGSTVPVPAGEGTATGFTAELSLPSESGVYTVAVYFDEVKESKTSTLQLYGAPEITSISIPKAGTGYAGNKLPVTIKGKNFTAQGISAASFSGTLALSDIKIVSDTIVTATVDCPYTAGETNLTVTCMPTEGASVQGSEKIIVKDYTAYTVGKIVLADKTVVDKDSYAIDSNNPPVGIICGSNSYKVPLMIALHTSGSNLRWAKYGSAGYTTKFEGIICKPSTTGSGAAQTATFTGDTDGSDNWEYIKSIDPAGAADAAENYPAFQWVNTYNETYKTQLGEKRFDWYMPSLAELCEVYKNRTAINASLAKISSLNSSYADASLYTLWYWSSSQTSSSNSGACYVDFSDGYVKGYYKDRDTLVCCLAGF